MQRYAKEGYRENLWKKFWEVLQQIARENPESNSGRNPGGNSKKSRKITETQKSGESQKKLQEVKKNVLLIQGKLVEILRGTAKEFKGGIVVEIKEETSKGIQGRIMEFREQS